MNDPLAETETALVKCLVISCPNIYNNIFQENPRFFHFPSDTGIAQIWKEKCGVSADHNTEHSKVCSDHFRQSDYENDSLRSDAIPRENLGWMIGMPEVKLMSVKEVKDDVSFEEIKYDVDTNERLKQHLQKLIEEQKPLVEKIDYYKKKINSMNNEMERLKGLIEKYPKKRKCNKIETNLISKVFSQTQINMLLGKKKVVWSYDDMAMAFTLRHIGNKECYLYLKDTLNMPLPALSAVQKWVASTKPKP